MYMKLFDKKTDPTENKVTEDKEKKIQLIRNVYSVLSRDFSMSDEMKQKILIGALIHTTLSAKEVQADIENRYTFSTIH